MGAGCTLGGPREGTFVLPDADVVECQQHQDVVPSSAYAGDADSDTVAMLDLLRYWRPTATRRTATGSPPARSTCGGPRR